MWTEGKSRKDRRLRKELLVAAAQGKNAAKVGEDQATDGQSVAADRIVIFGWTGEPFIAPVPRKTAIRTATPVALHAWSSVGGEGMLNR